MIAPALRRMARPVDDLTPHPRNARQGDVGAISQSLERFGQVRPIVVQKATGYVVAGNHVLAAARALGWPKVAAVEVDLTDQEAIAYLVADNRIADLGTYDDRGIAELLGELVNDGGLEGTGYDGEDTLVTLPPKHRYIYPFDKALRRRFSAEALPYPKPDREAESVAAN